MGIILFNRIQPQPSAIVATRKYHRQQLGWQDIVTQEKYQQPESAKKKDGNFDIPSEVTSLRPENLLG